MARRKNNPDIDFCLKSGAINFGHAFSRKIKSGFVVLDKEHGCCRLVKKAKGRLYTLDFTDFRGRDLKDDLLHRDFTVNTLTLELEKIFSGRPLADLFIDPFGARKDAGAGVIRLVNKRGFDEDPLRIMRAFSLGYALGFRIEKETLKSASLRAKKLARVSSERIRDELFKIFDTPEAFSCLEVMDKLKILRVIFPEIERMRDLYQGPYHHLDVLRHSLETVRQLEMLFGQMEKNKIIQDYLNAVISSERRRRQLMKLGALLHDIGKPQALRREDGKIKFHGHERIGLQMSREIARRLRLSNDELAALEKMVLWHLRPGYLADYENPTPRAKFRYFRDAGCEAVSTLLLSIADQRSTKGRLTTRTSRLQHERVVFGMIKEYFRNMRRPQIVRLVNGDDLMRRFKLEPSPLIGKVLRELEELQAIGKVKTKAQACAAARKILA
jgi:putative nucleotidyltransferase with HDIG domain